MRKVISWHPGRGLMAPSVRVGLLICLLTLPGMAADEAGLRNGDLPTGSQILAQFGFETKSVQRVLAGHMEAASLASSSKRELSLTLAFLVAAGAHGMAEKLDDGLAIRDDPDTIAFGEIRGEGSEQDFLALHLEDKDVKRWLDAKAGENMNLSSGELARLDALKKRVGGTQPTTDAVGATVRNILLARYRAYRASGLAGIAPYQRGRSRVTDAGGELRGASRASKKLGVFPAAFYDVLLEYPKKRPPGLEEDFYWLQYKAHGERVLMLAHRFSVREGDYFVSVQRQFYVSRGYNVEQSLSGLAPSSNGTLVIYTNRTISDQLEGFGASMRRSIGNKLLSSQLEGLYKKIRADVADPKSPGPPQKRNSN
ncbi:MAG: hypothetical protein VCB99_05795 [Myxococcota bacterium]